MKSILRLSAAVVASFLASAEIPPEQRAVDFQHLASFFNKHYAPYEWKRDALGFDALDLSPWLGRLDTARDDLEFYELCLEYVARLDDGHVFYYLPSTLLAQLGFRADLYEGKALIDRLDRTVLPADDYPFEIGDELVSVDGVGVAEFVREGERLFRVGNPVTTRRYLASYMTYRSQLVFPRAVELKDEATVVIRRAGGAVETYQIPWRKTGRGVEFIGPVPTPKDFREARSGRSLLARLRNRRAPMRPALTRLGDQAPLFDMPEGFRQRLGRASGDYFYSGTYTSAGVRIGLLRIPDFDPASLSTALRQFQTEIDYFRQNTDALVVDVMHNPGGDTCYTEELLARVIPEPFRTIGDEIRATQAWIQAASAELESMKAGGAPDYEVATMEAILADLETAYRENRGRTGPIGLCHYTLDLEPARDSRGNLLAYDKPLFVLTDEFSGSAADMFAAVIQDNRRGSLVGARTWGLGGAVDGSYTVGLYSEGYADVTITMGVRKAPVAVPGYPVSAYLENVGVWPDVPIEFMTEANLRQRGKPFVDSFTAAVVEAVRTSAGGGR